MKVYLLRHGDALSNVSEDRLRPLSDLGNITVRRIAEYIKKEGYTFSKIITSPLLRAYQTANITCQVLNLDDKLIESENLLPECNPIQIIDEIKKYNNNESILLVGHQPLLGKIISFLISKNEANIEVKKASLTCIEINQPITRGDGILKWIINHEQCY